MSSFSRDVHSSQVTDMTTFLCSRLFMLSAFFPASALAFNHLLFTLMTLSASTCARPLIKAIPIKRVSVFPRILQCKLSSVEFMVCVCVFSFLDNVPVCLHSGGIPGRAESSEAEAGPGVHQHQSGWRRTESKCVCAKVT